MENSRRLFVLKKTKAQFRATETYLTQQGWEVDSGTDLKSVLLAFLKKPFSLVLICVDHPHPKIRVLPAILQKFFHCEVMGFTEGETAQAIKVLEAFPTKLHLYPPMRGPSVDRELSRIMKDKTLGATPPSNLDGLKNLMEQDAFAFEILQEGQGASGGSFEVEGEDEDQSEKAKVFRADSEEESFRTGESLNSKSGEKESEINEVHSLLNSDREANAIVQEGPAENDLGSILQEGETGDDLGSILQEGRTESDLGSIKQEGRKNLDLGSAVQEGNIGKLLHYDPNQEDGDHIGHTHLHSKTEKSGHTHVRKGKSSGDLNSAEDEGSDADLKSSKSRKPKATGAKSKSASKTDTDAEADHLNAMDSEADNSEARDANTEDLEANDADGSDGNSMDSDAVDANSKDADATDPEAPGAKSKNSKEKNQNAVGGKTKNANAQQLDANGEKEMIHLHRTEANEKQSHVTGKRRKSINAVRGGRRATGIQAVQGAIANRTDPSRSRPAWCDPLDQRMEFWQEELEPTADEEFGFVELVEDCSSFLCWEIRDPEQSGFLLLAGFDPHVEVEWIEKNLQPLLLESFLASGAQTTIAEKPILVELEDVPAKIWSDYLGLYRRSFSLQQKEAILFFVPSPLPPVQQVAAGQMSSVSMSEVRTDEKLYFDLFLHFKENKKYVRFASRGRKIDAGQKDRLMGRGVQEFHITNEGALGLKRFRIETLLQTQLSEFYSVFEEAS